MKSRPRPEPQPGDEFMLVPKFGRGRVLVAVRAEESPRVRDRKYLDTAPGRPCAACGQDAACAAHIRVGQRGGVALKPSDDEIDWLCMDCHEEQEANPGPAWWVENCYVPGRKRAYRAWKEGK